LGKPCPHLEENTVPGHRWTCGLRRELGNWDAVLADPRYQDFPGSVYEPAGINCRDWPNGNPCYACKGQQIKAMLAEMSRAA